MENLTMVQVTKKDLERLDKISRKIAKKVGLEKLPRPIAMTKILTLAEKATK